MDDIMKRILVLALVACFVLGATMANAKEVQFKASFEHTLEWTDNTNFLEGAKDTTNEDDFKASQRVRTYFQYVTSEDLRAVIGFEYDTVWGAPDSSTAGEGSGGAIGTDGGELEIKHAYTDFKTGPLSWRVGLQGLAWPSAVAGSPIADTDVSGIVTSYAFNENVSVVLGYTRLYDDGDGDNQGDVDAVTAILPITMDGWSLTPYGIYAMVGKDAATAAATGALQDLTNETGAVALTDDLTGLWLGGALKVTAFDPITFGMDLIYGSVDGDEAEANDRSGWYWAGIATYKMDMVTPSLALIYGSGEDEDGTNGSETMPTLAGGGNGGKSGLNLTEFGLNGAAGTETGEILNDGRTDFMAVALILDDISFVESLKHKFVLMYGQGTSDKKAAANGGVVVTEKDSFWEVNLDSSYAIYENLALNVNLAYVDVDRGGDVWTAAQKDLDAASKLYVNLTYKF
jgi:hypothetical protein